MNGQQRYKQATTKARILTERNLRKFLADEIDWLPESKDREFIIAEFDRLHAEIGHLRKGIKDYLDGNYENARKHRHEDPQYRCAHGQHYWEDCGCCIDEHFQELLDGNSK